MKSKKNNLDKIDKETTNPEKVDNNMFNNFLKLNKTKIDAITPKNPIISKDDEWQKDEDTNN